MIAETIVYIDWKDIVWLIVMGLAMSVVIVGGLIIWIKEIIKKIKSK